MNKLKELREEKKLTQAELAAMVGVTREAVTLWEMGVNFPRTDKLVKIANIFNCTVDELLRI